MGASSSAVAKCLRKRKPSYSTNSTTSPRLLSSVALFLGGADSQTRGYGPTHTEIVAHICVDDLARAVEVTGASLLQSLNRVRVEQDDFLSR